ncbi:hypothetical protein BCD67_24025 [Oscillatoriales cyanobacterium USR001]|nr:hypothetical protein BCD67_24025 [Oscillatoriales cyanobacterium USR001]
MIQFTRIYNSYGSLVRSLLSRLAIVSVCFTLVACPKKEPWDCAASESVSNKHDNATRITPIIQIDGTPSMQGFVQNIRRDNYGPFFDDQGRPIADPNGRSIFNRTLRLIDDTFAAFPKSESPKYYRFGTKREDKSFGNKSDKARYPNFYGDYFLDKDKYHYLGDAKIDKAIIPVDGDVSDEISIIVTDLYQQNAVISDVIASLRKHYLEKQYAVGVIALKSQFDGTVYDINLGGNSQDYRTSDQYPQKFRPFYLLVLGTYDNVSRFFDTFKDKSKNVGLNFAENKFVIFSSLLVKETSMLNITKPTLDNNGIERQFTINDGQVMIEVKNEQTIDRLMITNKAKDMEKINYQVDYQPLSYTLPIRPESIEFKIQGDFNNNTKDFSPDQNIDKIFNLGNAKFLNNRLLTFEANLNTNEMQTGVYKFIVDLIPRKVESPKWWKEQNLSENDQFDGSRTYNLFPFLQDLSDLTIKSQQPIGHFCYILHKK